MLATSADFNAIADDAENGIAVLLRLLAHAGADQDRVLFSAATPVIAGTGPWTVTVPPQYFALDGVPAITTQQVIAVPATGNRDVAVFLRIQRVDVNEARAYLDATASPPEPAAGTADFTVATTISATAELVDPYTGPGDDLAPGDDDVGTPMLYAILTASGASLTSDYDPDGFTWQVPTDVVPSDHAATHVAGGGDAIRTATPLLDGLISAADMATVREALTDLSISGSSPYLVRTITGDNDPTAKTVALEVRVLSDTFRTVVDNAQSKLALNYQAGGLAGTSNRPARADHRHDLSGSPVQVAQKTVTIDTLGQLGSLIQVEVPAAIATVLSVNVAWSPPGISAPYYPLVEAAWNSVLVGGTARRVGVKYNQKGARDLWIQLGDYALCELTTTELAEATVAAGNTVTWAAASLGAGWPTTGTLSVRIIGTQVGVTL